MLLPSMFAALNGMPGMLKVSAYQRRGVDECLGLPCMTWTPRP